MDCPRLRPIDAVPVQRGGRVFLQLYDPARLSPHVLVVPQEIAPIVAMLDGTNTVRDIQAALMRQTGALIFAERIQEVVDRLDEALLLHSDRFRAHRTQLEEAFRQSAVREPCSAGSAYPTDPHELRRMLDASFTADGGPALPHAHPPDGSVAGLIAPHIDFERGGVAYAHAYKALAQGSDADLFVVLGTAHFAADSLYILTRKSFATPFGTAPTAAGLVDALASRAGQDLFAEELVHRNEHSIEFQVLCLQHVLDGRDFEILPILCCSMDRAVGDEESPLAAPAVADFLGALRDVVGSCGRKVCVIAGADLAHVGRQFGDEFALTPQVMADVEAADRQCLSFIEQLDADGFYDSIRIDGNARNVCGLPPIYALMNAIEAARCELLDYRQATDYDLQRAVTFASLAFYA